MAAYTKRPTILHHMTCSRTPQCSATERLEHEPLSYARRFCRRDRGGQAKAVSSLGRVSYFDDQWSHGPTIINLAAW